MKKGVKSLLAAFGLVFLCGCSTMTETASETQTITGTQKQRYEKTKSERYDSADLCVVQAVDSENHTLTFFNTNAEKSYTLQYDGTTRFFDKNEQNLTAVQVVPGDLVEITFLRESKHMNTLRVYGGAWIMNDVEEFDVSASGSMMEIGGEKYRITDFTQVYADGGTGTFMDVNLTDSLRIVGIDHTIYSMTVTKGHGYLRLENDEKLYGGWIEVGTKLIKPITEDMMLVVPEGKYDVRVSLGNASLKRTVLIERNKETTLDVAEFEPEEMKYGNLFFTVEPDGTEIILDGEKVKIAEPVEVSYGIHQMIAKKEGYETIAKYIKVASEYASLCVRLSKDPNYVADQDTLSGNNIQKEETSEESQILRETGETEETKVTETASSQTAQETGTTFVSGESETDQESDYLPSRESETTPDPVVTTSSRVYVDAPDKTEIYLDGAYVGIIPVNFKKVEGTHTVILRRDGYATKSYTISLDGELKDISYSFPPLLKEDEETQTE